MIIARIASIEEDLDDRIPNDLKHLLHVDAYNVIASGWIGYLIDALREIDAICKSNPDCSFQIKRLRPAASTLYFEYEIDTNDENLRKKIDEIVAHLYVNTHDACIECGRKGRWAHIDFYEAVLCKTHRLKYLKAYHQCGTDSHGYEYRHLEDGTTLFDVRQLAEQMQQLFEAYARLNTHWDYDEVFVDEHLAYALVIAHFMIALENKDSLYEAMEAYALTESTRREEQQDNKGLGL